MKIRYQPKKFSAPHLDIIAKVVEVCEAYRARGYDLTLRQVYYQLVAHHGLPNKDTEYKRLGGIVNDARLAGLIDWDYITDRTRYLRGHGDAVSPPATIRATAERYVLNPWREQPYYVENWIEKDALVDVLAQSSGELRVPYFSCRGYTSQSEMWGAAMRLVGKLNKGKDVLILHFGDHDPSGIDMTRDIRERLSGFIAHHLGNAGLNRFEVRRVALTMDQVDDYEPPPNPAKLTDSRANDYIDEWGDSSWELDALDPSVFDVLVDDNVRPLILQERWDDWMVREAMDRSMLLRVSRRWDEVTELVAVKENNEENDDE